MTLRLSGGRRLQSPPGTTARPTAARVRQAVLNLLATDLPGCRWLDLCCGSGVMACEALQRGASDLVAIESDRRVAAVARANLESVAAGLGSPQPRLRVIQADARRWLASHAPSSGRGGGTPAVASRADAGGAVAPGSSAMDPAGGVARVEKTEGVEAERPFDLIYCDPPWPAGLHLPLAEAVARGGWLCAGGTLVWECPSNEVPIPPEGWIIRDQRRYGGSTVVLLEQI